VAFEPAQAFQPLRCLEERHITGIATKCRGFLARRAHAARVWVQGQYRQRPVS
jgi:hypothetical protein